MKKASFPLIFLFVTSFLLALTPPGGNGWAPSWSALIGVTFSNPPNEGQSFSSVTGTIDAPESLKVLGFNGLKQGDRITLK